MKKIILVTSLFLINTFNLSSNEPKLLEIINGLVNPWSISFINEEKVLVTEKSGNILFVDFNKKK
jgi:hypothetical protein